MQSGTKDISLGTVITTLHMRRLVFTIWLVVVALAAVETPLRAQEAPFETKAAQAILIDARTGKVLFAKDADTPIPPASAPPIASTISVPAFVRSLASL